MQVRRLSHADAERWDTFCAGCHSATFLHTRKFLSYHGERFEDLSLILEEAGRWVGILPAARDPQDKLCVISHPGITYGSLLHQGALRGGRMIEALDCIRKYYSASGFSRLVYKAVPYIYHSLPAQDDLYALFRLDANRTRCDLSCTINLSNRGKPTERRRRCLKKARKAGVSVMEGREFAGPLWDVLVENLARKHGVAPVHSGYEIDLLAKSFPENIRFAVGILQGKIEAGVVLFTTRTTHHAQYIAASTVGYETSALDAVFEYCIESALAKGARWFDFGTSNEECGRVLNSSLYEFKSEFGGGGIAYEYYEMPLI